MCSRPVLARNVGAAMSPIGPLLEDKQKPASVAEPSDCARVDVIPAKRPASTAGGASRTHNHRPSHNRRSWITPGMTIDNSFAGMMAPVMPRKSSPPNGD